ncbi:MAG: tetratricopeptide repeat protein [Deltaproteobacteria bacterium]|jgi:TolB-like protein/Tfp pilus assembly protein PilF|nr:tetratricopeptide repeat protein [Deltaproteobacteria bacterium]
MRVEFGEFQLDTESRILQRGGRRIRVQSKAFDLLAYLIEHRQRVVSADELLDALWPGVHVTPAALSAAIQRARQAVGDDGEHQAVLRTEHGHGFRFVAEVSVDPAPEASSSTPTRSTKRLVAVAGVAALLVVAAAAWLLIRPITEYAPARSVAVLPFANLSQDAASEPFTNGIYDDVLIHISKIRDLKVIARTTMERLDPSLGVQEIGTQLGVAAVLEGGVQRSGDRVRINVQLINCETEAHLWAETYDRELTAANIFAIQSEIAISVADALRAELSPEEHDRIVSAPTENLAAYEAYLLGQQRMAELTIATIKEATGYFQQAIELDPSYALAYVGLADSYVHRADWGHAPRAETLDKAQVAVEKALALDDRLGEAYNSLGGIKDLRGDFEGADAAYQRALELNPNYATTYHWYGVLLRRWGRAEEALPLLFKAAELNPLAAMILAEVGLDLESLGRFEEALTWYERSLELDPMLDGVNERMGFYHWSVTGKLDQAVVWYRRAVSRDPEQPVFATILGAIYLDLGDPDKAEYWFERSIALGPEKSSAEIEMSFLHLYQGDEPAAAEQARKALTAFPGNSDALLILRDHELSAGRYAEARALYEKNNPDLLSDDDPKVGRMNWAHAVNLALVLFKTGEKERGDLLLEKSLQHIQSKPRLGINGYIMFDVDIFAMQGEKQKALTALRQAIDEGWRRYWWYNLKYAPDLVSLHDEPEYRAIVAEIEADMAAQLAHVREMEQNGELAAIRLDEMSPH